MTVIFLAYKRKPWVVQYREPWSGRPRQRSFATETEAVSFEETTRALYDRERAIIRGVKRRCADRAPGNPTVQAILDRYLDSLSNPSTRAASRYHLSLFAAIYGQRKAARITLDDTAAFLSLQKQRGVGMSTACRRLGIVRAAYNWAARWGVLVNNPLASLRLSTSHPQTPAPPTPHEARMIYAAAAPHVKRVIVLGMTTGPRIGPSELFRLRWSDVDLRGATLRMPNARKGARDESRDVPLRGDVVRMMRQWAEDDTDLGCAYVVNYRGRPVRRIGRAWHNARRRAGIARNIRPYDLRHAFATLLLDHDADIKCVMEVMGHTNEKMILRYYRHTNAEQRRKAVNAPPPLGFENS
jgi:integrase